MGGEDPEDNPFDVEVMMGAGFFGKEEPTPATPTPKAPAPDTRDLDEALAVTDRAKQLTELFE